VTRALFFFAFSACTVGCPNPSGFLNRTLVFAPNRGQAEPAVRFVARGTVKQASGLPGDVYSIAVYVPDLGKLTRSSNQNVTMFAGPPRARSSHCR
jgi:hypothetical protein